MALGGAIPGCADVQCIRESAVAPLFSGRRDGAAVLIRGLTPPGLWSEEEKASRRADFAAGAALQGKMAGVSDRWLGVVESGEAEGGAYCVMGWAEGPLEAWAQRHVASGPELYRLVHDVVEGLKALRGAEGRPHGRISLAGVMVPDGLQVARLGVMLTDPVGTIEDSVQERLGDLHAIGEMIQRVVARDVQGSLDHAKVASSPGWNKLGKHGAKWRKLAEELTTAGEAGDDYLDVLAKRVEALKTRPAWKYKKHAIGTAAMAAMVMIGVAVWWFFLGDPVGDQWRRLCDTERMWVDYSDAAELVAADQSTNALPRNAAGVARLREEIKKHAEAATWGSSPELPGMLAELTAKDRAAGTRLYEWIGPMGRSSSGGFVNLDRLRDTVPREQGTVARIKETHAKYAAVYQKMRVWSGELGDLEAWAKAPQSAELKPLADQAVLDVEAFNKALRQSPWRLPAPETVAGVIRAKRVLAVLRDADSELAKAGKGASGSVVLQNLEKRLAEELKKPGAQQDWDAIAGLGRRTAQARAASARYPAAFTELEGNWASWEKRYAEPVLDSEKASGAMGSWLQMAELVVAVKARGEGNQSRDQQYAGVKTSIEELKTWDAGAAAPLLETYTGLVGAWRKLADGPPADEQIAAQLAAVQENAAALAKLVVTVENNVSPDMMLARCFEVPFMQARDYIISAGELDFSAAWRGGKSKLEVMKGDRKAFVLAFRRFENQFRATAAYYRGTLRGEIAEGWKGLGDTPLRAAMVAATEARARELLALELSKLEPAKLSDTARVPALTLSVKDQAAKLSVVQAFDAAVKAYQTATTYVLNAGGWNADPFGGSVPLAVEAGAKTYVDAVVALAARCEAVRAAAEKGESPKIDMKEPGAGFLVFARWWAHKEDWVGSVASWQEEKALVAGLSADAALKGRIDKEVLPRHRARWVSAAARAAEQDVLVALLDDAVAGSVPAAQLPVAVRYNLRVRQYARDVAAATRAMPDAAQEKARQAKHNELTEAYLKDIAALKVDAAGTDFMPRRKDFEESLAAAVKGDAAVAKDQGPARLGWELATINTNAVEFTWKNAGVERELLPSLKLRFERVGKSRTFLCTTAVDVGLFHALAKQNNSELVDYLRGMLTDTQLEQGVWGWTIRETDNAFGGEKVRSIAPATSWWWVLGLRPWDDLTTFEERMVFLYAEDFRPADWQQKRTDLVGRIKGTTAATVALEREHRELLGGLWGKDGNGQALAVRPNWRTPVQNLSPVAAAYLAHAAGCRLPTASELREAGEGLAAAGEAGVANGGANLRDATWAKQWGYLNGLPRSSPLLHRDYTPESYIFFPPGEKEKHAAAKDANSEGRDDGVLWFANVDGNGQRKYQHLDGNVSVFVVDAAAWEGIAKALGGGGDATAKLGALDRLMKPNPGDATLTGVQVAGRSALSPRDRGAGSWAVPAEGKRPQHVRFADVGMRLAFTGRPLTVEEIAKAPVYVLAKAAGNGG